MILNGHLPNVPSKQAFGLSLGSFISFLGNCNLWAGGFHIIFLSSREEERGDGEKEVSLILNVKYRENNDFSQSDEDSTQYIKRSHTIANFKKKEI